MYHFNRCVVVVVVVCSSSPKKNAYFFLFRSYEICLWLTNENVGLHHTENINFYLNSRILITNAQYDQLPVCLSWKSTALVSQRSWVRIPLKPDYFFRIFRLSFRNCLSCLNNCVGLQFNLSFRRSNICFIYSYPIKLKFGKKIWCTGKNMQNLILKTTKPVSQYTAIDFNNV